MPRPNPETIKRAIDDVQQAYDELHAQLLAKLKEADEIKDRLSKLEAFINPAKALLSLEGGPEAMSVQPPPQTPTHKPIHVPAIILEEKPLLQGGIEILKEAKRPMHLNEIVEEFRKRRWKLSEKNGTEVLRFTFKKHIGTIFAKTGKGLYDLKERPGYTPLPPLIRREYPKIETEAPKEQ